MKSFPTKALFFILLLVTGQTILAQDMNAVLQQYLDRNKDKWELNREDISDWSLTDQYTDVETKLTHVYLHQQYEGIRIFNAVSSAVVKDNKVLTYSNAFHSDVESKVNTRRSRISPSEAIYAAIAHLNLRMNDKLVLQGRQKKKHTWTYAENDIARKPIRVEMVYQLSGNKLLLAYDVNLAIKGSPDWWNIRIDASTGAFLTKNNWTVSCDFSGSGDYLLGTTGWRDNGTADHSDIGTLNQHTSTPAHQHTSTSNLQILSQSNLQITSPNSYSVYALPTEAPSFGPRQLLVNPAEALASPYGWHDTDGLAGAEFTITRGNNVYAYTDTLGNDLPQYSPDGGTDLSFDFPIDLNQQPTFNKDAIVTNLFYLNNRVHDILHHYGFTEAAGNFQAMNYSTAGAGDDYVLAEAQDGGGTNNANFSTPPDGMNGVMQMYLWSATSSVGFVVNSPSGIAGTYQGSGLSSFGPTVPVAITQNLILVNDNTAPVTDACDPILNAAALSGKIALIDRGTCAFVNKVQAVEALGAVAAIIINNAAGAPFTMGGAGSAGIPSFMISQADGAILKAALNDGQLVNATIPTMGAPVSLDGSLDNGIVVHEYGHGVSNRLTGGPSNSNCLDNAENGSEGWSDWLALILTLEPGDTGTDNRPVGTYALGEPTTGFGIRNYLYSTDMSVNPHTYASLAISGEIHDIGEIWAATLWDLTWKLVDLEGINSDWITGTGGNITAMKLVLTGMKLQPCNPGFLDSRDAILMADSLLYNGSHTCLIWEAFAGRGMGANASQGNPGVTGDEVENFDLPFSCQFPTSIPTANFSVSDTSNCTGDFAFFDQSSNIPQSWLWDFGDGSLPSTQHNPMHTYTVQGTYIVTLIVSNTLGSDTATTTLSFSSLAAPTAQASYTVCGGHALTLTASGSGNNFIEWTLIGNDTIIHTGTSYTTPLLYSNTTYEVRQHEPYLEGFVGPVDPSWTTGAYHNTTFEGKEKFVTYAPMRLISCLVDANGSGLRTVNLYDQSGSVLLQSMDVSIPAGQSTITLNLEIPVPGTYWIGVAAGSDLYRNNNGANYPYTLANLVSILTSNSTSGPQDYYYYLYNWKVEEMSCLSEPVYVNVEVAPGVFPDFAYTHNDFLYTFTDMTGGVPFSWNWDFGDGTTSVLQNPSHQYTQPGLVTVQLTVTNMNGDCIESVSKELTVTVGIDELNPKFNISLSPIPARDEVILTFGKPIEGKVTIEILSLEGKVVQSYQYDRAVDQLSLPLNKLSDGMYYLRLLNKGGSAVKKLSVVR